MVNARIPASVIPSTRIEIHPSEWLILVNEISDLSERLLFATLPKASPELIAEARRQGKLPPDETTCSGWQPISTAPQGTLVLCYWTPVAEGGPDAIGTAMRSYGTWHRQHSMYSELRTPSHWMPIPASPLKTTDTGLT